MHFNQTFLLVFQLKVEKSYLKCPKEELMGSVKELSKQLDSVTILCKGPTDIISNGIDGKWGSRFVNVEGVGMG